MACRARTRASHAVVDPSSAGSLTPGAYRRGLRGRRPARGPVPWSVDPRSLTRAAARPVTITTQTSADDTKDKADRGDDQRPQERPRAQPRRAAVVRRGV